MATSSGDCSSAAINFVLKTGGVPSTYSEYECLYFNQPGGDKNIYKLEKNFSCVNQSFMLRGKEQLSEDTISSYLGFFLQDGTYLDIANMTTGTYYGFTKE